VKKAFVRPYVTTLGGYFSRAKLPLSRLVDRTRPKADFSLPEFASLEDFASWMQTHLKWRLDRLAGMLDVFPSLEYVGWQLENNGVVEDDCDGLAYVAARGALQLADAPADVYVVTLVLDPATMAMASAAHVICVFRRAGKWYVVSNGRMDARQYPSFWAAVTQNSYSQGREIKFLEARDANLERVEPPGR
jgi:hypothetical protein